MKFGKSSIVFGLVPAPFPREQINGDSSSQHAKLHEDANCNGALQAKSDQWRAIEQERQVGGMRNKI
jgi:hypothetical protein